MNFIYILIPCWPLPLPPPAVSTSPSRSHCSSSSFVIESPSRRPLLTSCCRAVHRRCTTPFITVKSPLCRPSPPIAVVILVHRRRPPRLRRPLPSRRCCAISRRRGAIAPSIAVEKPPHCLSLSRSRCTIHCHLGSVMLSLAFKDHSAVSRGHPHIGRSHRRHPPLVTPLPPGRSSGRLLRCHSSHRRLPSAGASHCGIASRASRPADCCDSSLLTLPPPIYQHLRLSSRRRLLSHPSWSSRLAGKGVASPHAAATYQRDN